jgi:hypothetical protein
MRRLSGGFTLHCNLICGDLQEKFSHVSRGRCIRKESEMASTLRDAFGGGSEFSRERELIGCTSM